jgi:hypothetical protein
VAQAQEVLLQAVALQEAVADDNYRTSTRE